MRLDKFLKASRLIKRRTLAKEACDRGQVTVNNRMAKAGTEIKLDDILVINFGNRTLKIKIVSVQENVPAKTATSLYEILEDSRSL
ncbi:MAG: RNA-binding S4 domain-containing protein [Desulfotomaculaceae bacterium]|nr:RNA-binding S4 domain-containing protein [Desulfotomaculaceae bacterium]